MLIILSPAKTMNMSSVETMSQQTTPQFINDANLLAQKMKGYTISELSRLLKISDALARINHNRYQEFEDLNVSEKAAIFAYEGSVFKVISPNDFSIEDLIYTQQRVRIISTLYGLLRPLDMIKGYRLAYNLKLEGLKRNLYDYWREKLTESLINDTKSVGGTLINLASLDVQGALDMMMLRKEILIITPEFRDMRNGEYEVVRTYAKIARGAMTRFIIKERVESVEGLKSFNYNGYKFSEMLSDETNYIFLRG